MWMGVGAGGLAPRLGTALCEQVIRKARLKPGRLCTVYVSYCMYAVKLLTRTEGPSFLHAPPHVHIRSVNTIALKY